MSVEGFTKTFNVPVRGMAGKLVKLKEFKALDLQQGDEVVVTITVPRRYNNLFSKGET